ncbi:MAG: tRNA (N6-threonylcarbamoyladenosine(37)-N6)-methyltransferase TrmO [Candidatus Nezhaarchaeales archaeon]
MLPVEGANKKSYPQKDLHMFGLSVEGTALQLKPIGVVHVNLSDEEVKASLKGVEGILEVYEEYAEGLHGIEGFSHLMIITLLHKVSDAQRKTLKVKPKRLKLLGLNEEDIPEVGVFCTDSPHRPNPLALTIVELVEVNGRFLKVRGLDLFNGTPILDIKPYTPSRRVEILKLPEWYQRILKKLREKNPDVKDF